MSDKWWIPRNPEELDPEKAEPWLHPAVILYIESLLKPHFRVLEHGAGGSTFWLAERVKEVVTIESDASWFHRVKGLAPKNVNLIYWDQPTVPEEVEPLFDLFLIDGRRDHRPFYVDVSYELVRKGGIVILDNYNRPEYLNAVNRIRKAAKHYITFLVNPVHHKFSNTEFYRLKGGRGEEAWI